MDLKRNKFVGKTIKEVRENGRSWTSDWLSIEFTDGTSVDITSSHGDPFAVGSSELKIYYEDKKKSRS